MAFHPSGRGRASWPKEFGFCGPGSRQSFGLKVIWQVSKGQLLNHDGESWFSQAPRCRGYQLWCRRDWGRRTWDRTSFRETILASNASDGLQHQIWKICGGSQGL